MKRILALILAACLLLVPPGCLAGGDVEEPLEFLIVMPYNPRIKNPSDNALLRWLEEQSGVSLRIQMVKQERLADYLGAMSTSGSLACDLLWGFEVSDNLLDTNMQLRRFAERGYILPLGNYIDAGGERMRTMFADFTDYDLEAAITSSDGNIYYVPALRLDERSAPAQVLWLNRGWLERLRLPVPATLEELRGTLAAFRDGDPNGNGLPDEVPLCGLRDEADYNTAYLLLNSFTCFDWQKALLREGEWAGLAFSPADEAFETGVRYIAALHAENLLIPAPVSTENFGQLVCDPRDLIGGFSAADLSDLIPVNETQVLGRFIPLAPLAGPDGFLCAPARHAQPQPAGLVASSCRNPGKAYELMDLMLSEEASLRALFGEPGVDWEREGDAISILRDVRGTPQNTTLGEACPYYLGERAAASLRYAGTLEGPALNREAARLAAPYLRNTGLAPPLPALEDISDYLYRQNRLTDLVQQSLAVFFLQPGTAEDDAAWELFREQLAAAEYEAFTGAAAQAIKSPSTRRPPN